MNNFSFRRLLPFILIPLVIAVALVLLLNKDYLINLLTSLNKPKPGSCLILEEKYCHSGFNILKGTAIGFNIPPGTPIFAPFDGTKETGTKAGKYRVVLVTVYSDDKHDKIVLDVEMWPVDVSITGSTVKKGEVIAKTSSIVVSEAGNYNLAVRPSVGSFTAPEVETFVKPFYKSLKL